MTAPTLAELREWIEGQIVWYKPEEKDWHYFMAILELIDAQQQPQPTEGVGPTYVRDGLEFCRLCGTVIGMESESSGDCPQEQEKPPTDEERKEMLAHFNGLSLKMNEKFASCDTCQKIRALIDAPQPKISMGEIDRLLDLIIECNPQVSRKELIADSFRAHGVIVTEEAGHEK